ncbi:hypothetical protein ACOSP7_002469 [Xanthoceras sorbifolium]
MHRPRRDPCTSPLSFAAIATALRAPSLQPLRIALSSSRTTAAALARHPLLFRTSAADRQLLFVDPHCSCYHNI